MKRGILKNDLYLYCIRSYTKDIDCTGCFDEMTQYLERVIFTLRDVCSPEACQKLCVTQRDCFFFMHHATTRVCRLMRRTRATRIPRKRDRFPFVSGPSDCSGEKLWMCKTNQKQVCHVKKYIFLGWFPLKPHICTLNIKKPWKICIVEHGK